MKAKTFESRAKSKFDFVCKRFGLTPVTIESSSQHLFVAYSKSMYIDGCIWQHLTNMPGISYWFQTLQYNGCTYPTLVISALKSKRL